ncbi:MAG: T9SS type A sorting domain-containing protein [Candidatus Eisenbacteria bacterium]|nr:T9SS type A sorting domain-containing protein [Candidatus Eisenbacteria bacterium]
MRYIVPLVVLVLAAQPAGLAHAAWPNDPASGNVALCTAGYAQVEPRVVADGAGGAIVTWTDSRGATSDIYVQRVSATGVPQWTADGVALCTAAGDQSSATIASDGAGGSIVTWTDGRGASYDIYAQRVNAAGVPQWTANGVALCTATGTQAFSTVVADGGGGAIVTWEDARGGATWDVYAQRVSAAGAPQWTANGVALCTATNDQTYPVIASDGAGGAVVTWTDLRGGVTTDIYVQRISAAGATQWGANGAILCNAANGQAAPAITPDGVGGAIVAWTDYRSGTNNDIYAQRISAAGTVQWTANGAALCTAAGNQVAPTITSDGSGGAIVTWSDYRSGTNYDIYAQRIGASGASQWTADGVSLCTAANDQAAPTITSDGAGGAIVTWYDYRSGVGNDIYAQRVGAAGGRQWAADGAAICTAAGSQYYPMIVPDGGAPTGGGSGAIIVWQDNRNGPSADIYAQRIERYGYLGNPEPVIAGVSDYPNDQGGKVRVSWSASYLDAEPYSVVGSYLLWRQAPALVAEAALRAGARLVGEGEEPAAGGRAFRAAVSGAQTYYWEYVTSQIAQGFPGYSLVTSTGSDSVAGSNPYTLFMVEAKHGTATSHWDSAPDSGYSVDDLPPASPAPFTGTYSAGTATLFWSPSPEADFYLYRLYRGTSAGFVPGPGNLVVQKPDPGYADAAGAPYYYKLSAMDVHGNESGFTTLLPEGTVDVPGGAAPAELVLAAPSPNPARSETAIRFDLPRVARVRLAVYDAAGRRVRLLRDGALEAGTHRAAFALRDDAGRALASGLYVVRLEAGDRVLTRRLIAVR